MRAWSVIVCGRLAYSGERGGGEVHPRRQPAYERIDRLIHPHQASAGMAKQCELQSKAQMIGSAGSPRAPGRIG